MGLILLIILLIVVLMAIVYALMVVPLAVLNVMMYVMSFLYNLPCGKNAISVLKHVVEFMYIHKYFTIGLAIGFFLLAFLFDDLFNVVVRGIWLSFIFYSLCSSKLVFALIIVFSIASLFFKFYPGDFSRILCALASGPILFLLAYSIIGIYLNKGYDYLTGLQEDFESGLILAGLFVVFAISIVVVYKMNKRENVLCLKEVIFKKKHLVKLYKPCLIISLSSFAFAVIFTMIFSVINGYLSEPIIILKIVGVIIVVCLAVFAQTMISRNYLLYIFNERKSTSARIDRGYTSNISYEHHDFDNNDEEPSTLRVIEELSHKIDD